MYYDKSDARTATSAIVIAVIEMAKLIRQTLCICVSRFYNRITAFHVVKQCPNLKHPPVRQYIRTALTAELMESLSIESPPRTPPVEGNQDDIRLTPASPHLQTPFLGLMSETLSSIGHAHEKAAIMIQQYQSTAPATSSADSATLVEVVSELTNINTRIDSLSQAFDAADIKIIAYFNTLRDEINQHTTATVTALNTELNTPGPDRFVPNSIEEITTNLRNLTTRVVRMETAPVEDPVPGYH